MKIHIFYRHYNISGNDNRGRPLGFDFEKCFQNLLNTIKGKNVNLHVIMDGDVNSNFISKYKNEYTLHLIKANSDYGSYLETYKYIKGLNIDNDNLIYFLENDYLHISNWVDKVIDLFSTYDLLHYVSLYDHNDKYFLDTYNDLISKIFVTKSHHWRTTPSTCGSYIIKKQLLLEDEDINTSGPGDHERFIERFNKKQRMVLTPIPGLSTHCMEGLMSPTIDWELINKNNIK
jgi:hypothetical protein